jgi:hypothetical protein
VSDDRKWESLPDPAQVAAFAAFRRPVVKADHSLTDDPVTASDLRPGVDPVLARRVYAGSEGTLDIVPGHGTLTFISIGADGSAVAGQTTTALAARDGLGVRAVHDKPWSYVRWRPSRRWPRSSNR